MLNKMMNPSLLYVLALPTHLLASNSGGQAEVGGPALPCIVNVKDFGAKGDGTTLDDEAIRKAALQARGRRLYFPNTGKPYRISSSILVEEHTTVEGDGPGSVVLLDKPDVSAFQVTGKTGVTFRNLRIMAASASDKAYTGAIALVVSSDCLVENLEIAGFSWSGVFIDRSSRNIVRGCRFSDWRGNVGDSADITVYRNSSFNAIENNHCCGGGMHGILVQDPYENARPTRNLIRDNFVGAHEAYGIAVYVTHAYDTQTLVCGNIVRDVLGTSLDGQSGAGIFIQSAGGSIVTGNHVSNCCLKTTGFSTLGMGQISVSIGTYQGGQPREVLVSNNHVQADRGPGIHAVTSSLPVLIEGNAVHATGSGGSCIKVSNVQGVKVVNNVLRQAGQEASAVSIAALDTEISGMDVSGNTIHTEGHGILFNAVESGHFDGLVCADNRVSGGTGAAFHFQKVAHALVSGCSGESSGRVFGITNCPGFQMTTTRLHSSYPSHAISFTAENPGSFVSETCDLDGIVENAPGSGVTVTQFAATVPPRGIWNQGDRLIQSKPAPGMPKSWRCVQGGSPGTWISEGLLEAP